jgi:hypothetical protein
MAVEAKGSSMSRLVSQSEFPKELWTHKDASCAAVDKCSYTLHLAMSVSYLNFMNNVR